MLIHPFLVRCNKNIAMHKRNIVTALRAGSAYRRSRCPPGNGSTLGTLPGHLGHPFAKFLALLRKSRDLGVHVVRVQRRHILGILGLQKPLREFERGRDVSLREPDRQFANFLSAGLHAGRLVFRCADGVLRR